MRLAIIQASILILLPVILAIPATAQTAIIIEGAQGSARFNVSAPSFVPAFIGFDVNINGAVSALWFYTLPGFNRTMAEEKAANMTTPYAMRLYATLIVVDSVRNVVVAKIPLNISISTDTCTKRVDHCPYGVIGLAAPYCLILECSNIPVKTKVTIPGLLPGSYEAYLEKEGKVVFLVNKTFVLPNGTKKTEVHPVHGDLFIRSDTATVDVSLWPWIAVFVGSGGAIVAFVMIKRREYTL